MTGQQVQGHTLKVPHLTVTEAAKELHLNRSQVVRLINSGDLPATNVAPKGALRKTWRIDVDDLRAFLGDPGRRNTP